jgi:PAS domain S-box-containing protein
LKNFERNSFRPTYYLSGKQKHIAGTKVCAGRNDFCDKSKTGGIMAGKDARQPFERNGTGKRVYKCEIKSLLSNPAVPSLTCHDLPIVEIGTSTRGKQCDSPTFQPYPGAPPTVQAEAKNGSGGIWLDTSESSVKPIACQKWKGRLAEDFCARQTGLERQNEELRRAQLQLENTCDRLSGLYDVAPFAYMTLDADAVIREANLTAARLLGVKRKFLLQSKKLTSFIARQSLETFYLHQKIVFTSAARQTCELTMRRQDGLTFVAGVVSIKAKASNDSRRQLLLTFSDITKDTNDKQAEKRVAQLSRVRAILGGVDHAIIHNTDQKKLLHEICRVAVDEGGFKLAWVGLVAPDGSVQPAAKAGRTGYLKNLRIHVSDVPEGRGPAGIAIRENRPVIINDVVHDLLMAPWHDRAQRFGLRYLAVFPIRIAGKVAGAIGLYAPCARFFDKDEVKMLSLLSEEISFALTAIDMAAKRKRAAEALLQSERELADFFDHSPLGLLWVLPDGRIQRINQAELELLGRTAEEALGQPIQRFHDDPDAITNLLDRLSTGATVTDYRARIRQKDGKIKHVLIDANGLWVKRQLKHTRWSVWDITRRVELEMEILTIGERIQRQLGQELHDDLCQQLTCIEFLSQSLAGELAARSEKEASQAREIAQLMQQAITKTRKLSHGLFPLRMDEGGLINALHELAKSIRQIFKIDANFQSKSTARWLNQTASIHLYRIAQEAVNNAIKHGKARRIDISVATSGGKMIMAVRSNGVSLPRNAFADKGIGLSLMHYRAGIIGGSLSIQREPDGRTAVVCTIRKHLQIQSEGTCK